MSSAGSPDRMAWCSRRIQGLGSMPSSSPSTLRSRWNASSARGDMARPVEGDHQQPAEVLVHGMPGGQHGQFPQYVDVPVQGEVGLDTAFERAKSRFLERLLSRGMAGEAEIAAELAKDATDAGKRNAGLRGERLTGAAVSRCARAGRGRQ
jgi:hypothetical protein